MRSERDLIDTAIDLCRIEGFIEEAEAIERLRKSPQALRDRIEGLENDSPNMAQAEGWARHRAAVIDVLNGVGATQPRSLYPPVLAALRGGPDAPRCTCFDGAPPAVDITWATPLGQHQPWCALRGGPDDPG